MAEGRGPGDSLDDQILFECYDRLAVRKGVRTTLDGQARMPCANPGVDDQTMVGSLRALGDF